MDFGLIGVGNYLIVASQVCANDSSDLIAAVDNFYRAFRCEDLRNQTLESVEGPGLRQNTMTCVVSLT